MLQPKILIGFEHFNFIDSDKLILSTEDGFSRVDMRPMKPVKNTFKVLMTGVTASDEGGSKLRPKINVADFSKRYEFESAYNNVRFVFNSWG